MVELSLSLINLNLTLVVIMFIIFSGMQLIIYTLLQKQFHLTAEEGRAYINNYIPLLYVNVITCPCPNFDVSLTKLC